MGWPAMGFCFQAGVPSSLAADEALLTLVLFTRQSSPLSQVVGVHTGRHWGRPRCRHGRRPRQAPVCDYLVL